MKTHIYPQEVANLHTHSHYCGHGNGEIAEYVDAARSAGLALLGFSEHCPLPDDRYRSTRMAFADQARYEADVRAQDGYGEMTILLGYECDYHSVYHSYLNEVAERTDYLLGAVHFLNAAGEADDSLFYRPLVKRDLTRYADRYCAMLQSGLFLYGVHPDLFTYSYQVWDSEATAISRAIIECALSEGVGLEINGYGLQKLVVPTADGMTHSYPHARFWALAGEYPGLRVVSSSDAHTPGDVAYGIEETGALARASALERSSYRLSDRGIELYQAQ